MSWNSSLIDGPISIPGVTGYHLNIAPHLLTEEVEVYALVPENPQRYFAGGSQAFLKFPDEATAKLLLADYWIDDAA